MNWDWIIPVVVIVLFAVFIYHRKQKKKDGRDILHRASGGKFGSRELHLK